MAMIATKGNYMVLKWMMGLVMFAMLVAMADAAEYSEHSTSRLTAKDNEIEATAIIRDDIDSTRCSKTEHWLAGHYLRICPVSVMNELEVIYKNDKVYVPKMAYNDLRNINDISIMMGDDNIYSIVVNANKNDIGCLYRITFRFKEKILLNRAVQHVCRSRPREGITEYIYDAAKNTYTAVTPESLYQEIFVDDFEIKAKAVIKKQSTGNCNDVPDYVGYSGGNFCPVGQLDKLTVTYNEDEVYIPVSAYNNLSRIRDLTVEIIGNGYQMYVVLLHGGPSHHHGYTVFLFFEGDTIRRRVAWSNIWTSQLKEETEYYHD